MRNYVKEIKELNESHVYMKDSEHVNRIIDTLVKGGVKRLQLVSDFDRTITKQHENGKSHLSSFGMFTKCASVTDEYKRETEALTNKYRHYECDPHLEKTTKIQRMEEWWQLTEEKLRGLRVSQKEIENVVLQLGPSLRDGSQGFFSSLSKADVPVLVFSAGLGDIVVAVLRHCDILFPNVEVVSNFLKYDDKGEILGFKDNLLHVYNKNEYAIKGTDFYNKIVNRDNVILLGDSIGDATMSEGMEHIMGALKIGFLYERSEEALPKYMDTFDIVLLDDQTMNVPNALFNLISNSLKRELGGN